MSVNPLYHQTNSRLMEELDWLQRAKDDPAHFAPLYRKYYEQIFRYVYQRMDDEDMAADVTSQVFLKAIKNLHKFEFRGVPFVSWLYRIAKSELYQAFRDSKADRTVNIDSVQICEFIEEFDQSETEMNRARLLKCLSLMKEEDMQLLELRFFERRSFKEIGEILEITENNAKVKSFRSLEKLKKLFLTKHE